MGKLDWSIFLQDTGGGQTYLEWLLRSWGWTLAVALLALLIALAVGGAVGILRTVPNRGLVFLGEAWTELFRNVPLIVQLFIWYFVLPRIIPALVHVPGFLLAVFGLGFFTSARIAEQIKAGILALPKGQRYAGLAVGLTLPQTYRYVIMPMALRIVIPPLTSESMNIVKNSSVAFAVQIAELTFFAQQAAEETSHGIEVYLAVTVLYFISAFVINRLASLVERRMQIPGMLLGTGK